MQGIPHHVWVIRGRNSAQALPMSMEGKRQSSEAEEEGSDADDAFKVISVKKASAEVYVPRSPPSSQAGSGEAACSPVGRSTGAVGASANIVADPSPQEADGEEDLEAELAAFEADAAEEIAAAGAGLAEGEKDAAEAVQNEGESEGSADFAFEEAQDAREFDEQGKLQARVEQLKRRMRAKGKRTRKMKQSEAMNRMGKATSKAKRMKST